MSFDWTTLLTSLTTPLAQQAAATALNAASQQVSTSGAAQSQISGYALAAKLAAVRKNAAQVIAQATALSVLPGVPTNIAMLAGEIVTAVGSTPPDFAGAIEIINEINSANTASASSLSTSHQLAAAARHLQNLATKGTT